MKLFFAFIFSLVVFGTLKCQTREILFGSEFFRFTGNVLTYGSLTSSTGPFMYKEEVDVITASPCVGYGRSIPFRHLGKSFSFEANPLVMANIIYDGNDFITGVKAPLSICFRFGAHANEACTKTGSLGIGGGITANALHVRGDFSDDTFYARPSLLFEFGNNDWKIRFDWIFNHTTYYKSYTGGIPYINYTQFSVTYVAWEFKEKKDK